MRDEKGRIATKNERVILDIIYRNPGVPRSELTHLTEWKQQSVHRLVDGLRARGLIEVTKSKPSGPGKPSLNLSVNPDAAYAIGFLINTDAVEVSLVNLGCKLVQKKDVDCDPSDMNGSLLAMKQAVNDILKEQSLEPNRVLGIGVAFTGFRLEKEDQFKPPSPLKEWENIPLMAEFGKVFDHPVWIENNATTGAIAEALVGAGLQHDTFVYLSFNHGFGAGVIHDGKPMRGANLNAGEISTLFGPSGMAHRPALGELRKRLRDQGIAIGSIRELCLSFDPTWPGVSEWITEITPSLELALRGIWAIVDPSAIVFGGEAPEALREELIGCTDIFNGVEDVEIYRRKPVLMKSTIKGDAGCFGAALLPLKNTVYL